MDRIILGIHGLNNKPDARLLRHWWKLSIRDGLALTARPPLPLPFKLIYWADLLYEHPLDPTIENEKSTQFLAHPYKPLTLPLQRTFHKRRQRSLERVTDQLMQNNRVFHRMEELSDWIIHSRFRDLDFYLNNHIGVGEAAHRPVRDVILERLANVLLKYKSKKVLLLAHSMGSIIAYDLLTQPEHVFNIDTLVTLGSPLGQPTLAAKFGSQNPVIYKAKTPENVKVWYNLSDLNDIIALNPTLGDDFAPNSTGTVPIDIFVENRYEWEGSKNPHAALGYLQTPECAELVYQFLTQDLSYPSLKWLEFRGFVEENILKKSWKLRQALPGRKERLLQPKRGELSKDEEFEKQVKS